MAKFIVSVYSNHFLGEEGIASHILKLLESYNLSPDKIGLFEPLKEHYSFDKAVSLWTKQSPSCYEEGIGNTGIAGGMIGKRKEPNFSFDVNWWKAPNVGINYIDYWFSKKTMTNQLGDIIKIFEETIDTVEGVYGYISHNDVVNRQHVTGTLETRLPGVFWCNYFSGIYVELFGRKHILEGPWESVKELKSGGIIAFLDQDPIKNILKSDIAENKAKEYLGKESFGDVEEYNRDFLKIQSKNVPKLLLPEYRIKV
jgi:hypothetical protein